MPRQKIRIIGIEERPWAMPRHLQGLLGRYVLDSQTGIYFQDGTDREHIAKIKAALPCVPLLLRENAIALGVTMSTTPGVTRSGNSSTTYADFSKRDKLSPHIEVGGPSLNGDKLIPHLIHEFSHLFLDNLPQELQDLWFNMIRETATRSTKELTEYADEVFGEWARSLDLPKSASYAKFHQQQYLRRYSKEAFCESTAALCVPTYRRANHNVSLSKRHHTIAEMGLTLPSQHLAQTA